MEGFNYGWDDLARGELAFFRGDLRQAEQYVRQALYKTRQKKQYEMETRAIFYLLRISLAQGDYTLIPELFKQLDAQLETAEYINRYILYDIITGWFYAHTGQAGKIASWLKNDFEESDLNSLIHGLENLVKIKSCYAEKKYPVVLASLENNEDEYGVSAYLFGKVETKALEAVSRYHIDEKEAAVGALEAAYTLAEPNGLDMPFIELGKDMRALISAIIKDKNCAIPHAWLERILRKSSAYAKKFFAATEKQRKRKHREQNPALTLSRREMDVLTGLYEGLTREEIAEASSISINTVKSAIKSVYNKLGAENRADAIRIATTMEIIKK
jgi:LuxR family maltose regulon positive regulatory protein